MAKKDPYKTLGVKKNATKEEIKKVYRTRSKKLHPDCGGDATEFANLSGAYSLLMDDERRANYDQTGETENKSEDIIRNNAMGMIGTLFISFVSTFGLQWKNKQVKQELNAKLSEAKVVGKDNLHKIEKEVKFWESVKEDVVFKGTEVDPINSALEEKLRSLQVQKLTVETDLKTVTLAIEILKNYDFKKPPKQEYTLINERSSYASWA